MVQADDGTVAAAMSREPQVASEPLSDAPVEAAAGSTPSAWRRAWRSPLVRPALVAVGTILTAVAATLPVWVSRLDAPQFPKGLWLWYYGGRVDGNVDSINGLNHYIGMSTIDPARIPELALWPLAVVSAGAFLAVALLARGWLGRLAALGIWLIPLVVLADIQRWLFIYGHELDPMAALTLEPFTPLVIGPTSVWNFTIWTAPGPALVLLLVVALLATFGRRAGASVGRTLLAVSAVSLTALTAWTVVVALPELQRTAGEEGTASGPRPASVAAAARSAFDLAAAIAGAPEGSTIAVPAGTYHGNLVVDRPVVLEATGHVVLDGGGRGSVVTIAAPGVTLRGFHLQGSGGQIEEAAGVKVVADDVTIEDNHISDAYAGVSVLGASRVRIVGNEIAGSGQVAVGADHATSHVGTVEPEGPDAVAPDAGHEHHGTESAAVATDDPGTRDGGRSTRQQGDGIYAWNVAGLLVRDNEIHDVRDGIQVTFVDEALIEGNRIHHSRYAVHAMYGDDDVLFGNTLTDNLSGLVLMYTRRVTAARNTIADNRSPATGFGVLLKDVAGLRLAENVILRNSIGLKAEGAIGAADGSPALVHHNRFQANGVGLELHPSSDLAFQGNTIADNLAQVIAVGHGVERRNTWSYGGLGNTWGDYAGFDLRGDGLGDVPYVAAGVVQALTTEAPAIEVYRTSPAFGVLQSSQAWWDAGFAPVVIDTVPLTTDVAPPIGTEPVGLASLGWLALGAALLLAGGGPMLAVRRTTARGGEERR